jgi:hypothetical protein
MEGDRRRRRPWQDLEVTPNHVRMRKAELSAQKGQTAASRKARGLAAG